MEWRLWGIFSLTSQHGGLLDSAGLVRWLSEAATFPHALLPSLFLRWEAVPPRPDQARAVVHRDDTTVSGVFTFDSSHNVVE